MLGAFPGIKMGLKKSVLVFGNEFLEVDNFAFKVGKKMENKFNMVYCRSPDEILECNDKNIVILDVIKNIDKPVVIKDISRLNTRKIISLHDFDVAFFLNLMKKMGIKKNIKIIGIPPKGSADGIAKEVEGWI